MLRTLAFLLIAAAQIPAQNWQSATVLPGNEMKSLTPAQQKTVLTLLREFA